MCLWKYQILKLLTGQMEKTNLWLKGMSAKTTTPVYLGSTSDVPSASELQYASWSQRGEIFY